MFRIMIIPTTTNIKILHITRHQEYSKPSPASFILADKFITQFSANQQVRLNLQEFPGRGGLILS